MSFSNILSVPVPLFIFSETSRILAVICSALLLVLLMVLSKSSVVSLSSAFKMSPDFARAAFPEFGVMLTIIFPTKPSEAILATAFFLMNFIAVLSIFISTLMSVSLMISIFLT